MSATRERGGRLSDAWTRAGGVVPVASGLRHSVSAVRASGHRHPRAALAGVLAALLLVLGCFWLWFKDSPFVSVSRVQVTGLAGPDVPQIRQALTAAAMRMTTLDVDMARLRAAARPYPDVRSLTVSTEFPHGMVIHVAEEVPVAQISTGGTPVAVSQDGSLLSVTAGLARLPLLSLSGPPSGTRVTGPGALASLAVLASAPYSFLRHIQSVQPSGQNGVVVQLHRGPQIRFGDSTQLRAKWAAALAVLAAPTAQGAQYIDVTDPGRPAAGAATASRTSGTSSGATSTAGSLAGATSSSVGSAGTVATPNVSGTSSASGTPSTGGGTSSGASSSTSSTGATPPAAGG